MLSKASRRSSLLIALSTPTRTTFVAVATGESCILELPPGPKGGQTRGVYYARADVPKLTPRHRFFFPIHFFKHETLPVCRPAPAPRSRGWRVLLRPAGAGPAGPHRHCHDEGCDRQPADRGPERAVARERRRRRP